MKRYNNIFALNKWGITRMNELTVVRKHEKLKDITLYFFIYSFIGWILETIYAFLVLGHFVKRGFLIGPICPIYGFGAVLLILLLKDSKGKPLSEFLTAGLAFTIFEYVVSYILEVIFGLRWWDYSQDFLNLQGRVSLAYSIIWGALGILLMEGINPYIAKIIEKNKRHIKIKYQDFIIITLVIICVIDFAISSIIYLKI